MVERDNRNNILDAMSTISFLIGVMNLNENISQTDVQNLVENAINDVNNNLLEQDKKIDKILKKLGGE